ncbi:FAD-binding protein [Streptomyces sp. NPDC088348]|uniref:FAD-binding protein n=1 Tax=Streptomyces sp. NPDC088348 TaxID=3365853 RepID=UPI00381E07DC
MNTEELLKECDVVVVGGGTAGLSGALTLARARRSVLVLDTGQPRNAPADAAHGLLSCDGVSPRDLLRAGRIEVAFYGGTLLQEGATSACRTDGGFVVGTRSGRIFRARRLLVTTGLVDELPGGAGSLGAVGARRAALPVLPRLGSAGQDDRGAGHQRRIGASGAAVPSVVTACHAVPSLRPRAERGTVGAPRGTRHRGRAG